jgi:hypothetical protein
MGPREGIKNLKIRDNSANDDLLSLIISIRT